MQTRSDRDRAARFTALYVRDHPRVCAFVHRRSGDRGAAEELTAEVFRIGWERMKAGQEVGTRWLFVTARNLLSNHYRSMARLTELHRTIADALGRAPASGRDNAVLGPVLVAQLLALLQGRAEAQMQSQSDTRGSVFTDISGNGLEIGGVDALGDFAADRSVYVTWNPSYVTGGAPVTSYLVTATPADGSRAVSTTVPAGRFKRVAYAVVDGLTNGTPYTVTVTARNEQGRSERSLPAAPVTPGPTAGALPDASTGVKANAEATAATVSWTPPKSAGATPVIGYRITVSDGRTVEVTGRDVLVAQIRAKGMLRVVSGLRPAAAYTFSVAAVTATGTGPAATASVTTPPA